MSTSLSASPSLYRQKTVPILPRLSPAQPGMAIDAPNPRDARAVQAIRARMRRLEREFLASELRLRRDLGVARHEVETLRHMGQKALDRAAAWAREAHRLRDELSETRSALRREQDRSACLETAAVSPWWSVMKRRAAVARARRSR